MRSPFRKGKHRAKGRASEATDAHRNREVTDPETGATARNIGQPLLPRTSRPFRDGAARARTRRGQGKES